MILKLKANTMVACILLAFTQSMNTALLAESPKEQAKPSPAKAPGAASPQGTAPVKSTSTTEIPVAETKVAELKKSLVEELQGAIKKGGPVNAISVCNTKAFEIAASMSKDGFTIGRTSHKLRSEKNQPKPWINKYLDQYQGLTKAEIDKRGMAIKSNEKLQIGSNGYR